jgi:hypothetical protein
VGLDRSAAGHVHADELVRQEGNADVGGKEGVCVGMMVDAPPAGSEMMEALPAGCDVSLCWKGHHADLNCMRSVSDVGWEL